MTQRHDFIVISVAIGKRCDQDKPYQCYTVSPNIYIDFHGSGLYSCDFKFFIAVDGFS
jgi:hypothetical protein